MRRIYIMLVHFRIDDRLIHGQVTVAWSKHINAQRIVVANDDAAKDDIQKSLLPLAAPPGVDVRIVPLKEALENIKDRRSMLLVKTPKDAVALLGMGLEAKEINIGNMGFAQGRKNLTKSLSLSEKEIEELREAAQRGVFVYFQMLPQDKKVPLEELVK
jgi:mannose/fructose/sorbose-specific phosphotransferase system IIB component